MKRVLIIGPNSYIAKKFSNAYSHKYAFKYMSVRSIDPAEIDISDCDAVVYFAAIVHNPSCHDPELYQRVNCDLPYLIAQKAIANNVAQFIFISTVAVWGIGPSFGNKNVINSSTPLRPADLYGKSKLNGENALQSLSDKIKITILRLPNVYGDDCPGNFYTQLKRLALFKAFPRYRKNLLFSLVSVENAAKAIDYCIENDLDGIFCPQDIPATSIQDRIESMAAGNGIKQIQFSWLSPLIRLANKVFPAKYTNNLYGGFLVDFPNPLDRDE